MTEKKNNLKRNVIIIGVIISVAISLIVFSQAQTDRINDKISNHPDVVLSKDGIEKMDERLKRIENKLERLERIEWKLDQLLSNEYP